MDAQYLRVAGVIINAVGAGILAFRVTRILTAVAAVLHVHEANIQQLMKEITGTNTDNIINLANSPAQVDKANKFGAKLLVVGFSMIFLGNSLIAIAILISSK
jgi:hypothetical protein